MAVVKKTKALIDAEKRIVELEKQLKDTTATKESFYKQYSEVKEVIDGLHQVLDELGLPGWKDDNKYYRLPLTVRLFSWAMKLAGK